MSEESPLTLRTIGHSTRTLDDFLKLLASHDIEALADVRRFPASRRHPQFNAGTLRDALPDVGVAYLPLPELGGRRRPRADSLNTAWRNESFRGYADYMETEEFRAGLQRLLDAARDNRTAIMCAEAVWWRCHRALIADYLKAAGIQVRHIMDGSEAGVHPYTSAAHIEGDRLSYVAGEDHA